MKKRDQAIQYGFDELSDDEMQTLQARYQSDPEFAKEASRYRKIKHDLASMRDIPECQLSVDRLRDAIFKSEMKSRRGSLGSSITWAPLGTLAFAALAWFVIGKTGSNEGTVAKPTELQNIVAKNDEVVMPPDFLGELPAYSEPYHANSSERIIEAATPRKRRVLLTRRFAVPGKQVHSERDIVALKPDVQPHEQEHLEPLVAKSGPVVVISDDQNSENGAAKANEVETTSHVVFGG